MMFLKENSDDAALKELGERIFQYRLNKNMTQSALANEAGVSERTIMRVEKAHSIQSSNLIRILRALNLLGNMEALIPEPPASPIQQAKILGKRRKRASTTFQTSKPKEPWSWGSDE